VVSAVRRGSSAFPEVDVTPGATWDQWVRGLPSISIDSCKIVVVAPHPDDETFGCGGLIAASIRRGAEVVVVTVTDGGGSHPGRCGVPELRRQEQIAAVAALGCEREPWWLAYPDGGATAAEPEIAAALLELATGADLIVAPWPGDRHPDHGATGRSAIAVGTALDTPVLTYPLWLWRWGAPTDVARTRWTRMPLGPEAVRAKEAAMRCYPSQTTDLLGQTIVDAAMLDRFARPVEVFSHG